MASAADIDYPILQLIRFWFHTLSETKAAASFVRSVDDIPACIQCLLGRYRDGDAVLERCAPKDPNVTMVCYVARAMDWHDHALCRWAVRSVADFLLRGVAGRSAGGWGDADLATQFESLASPDECPDALLVAAIGEASARNDVIGRMVSSVSCNYRLSASALRFLTRCAEDDYIAEEDLLAPAFMDAFEHQYHCDAPLRARMRSAANLRRV